MKGLEQLQKVIEDRLEYTRELIEGYDEKMDYATHCSLNGFAEGLEYVLEEVKSLRVEKGRPRKTAKR